MTEYYLREDMAAGELAAVTGAAQLLQWGARMADGAAPGDVYRHREGRKTLRCHWRGRPFFLKLHSGIGWREIAKNLLQLRAPVLGAANEYRAVRALERLGVDTLSVAAYACRGRNPATRQSLLLSDELVGTVSLEEYCADWASAPPPPDIRLRLLCKLADTARRMHGAGINHRDFYLCHFHLDPATLERPRPRCHLIDLHRAQLRRCVPRRWRVKDLAGLYFSAMDCGLSRRDVLRFIRHYSAGGLRAALGEQAGLWRDVERRALQLYRRDHRREPPAGPWQR
ncbi:MAG: lipopolysaccharide core heptose(I) kinase RfaP [Halioglobus sp.]|nr:lipopolysaccharide core heptose(I) kinase RfaP [Halioglobus sp.]